MDSILTSIKKLLGISEDYKHFDADIIIHINSVFSILTQIGIGPPEGFSINDSTPTWNDYIPNNPNIELMKSYMYLKVKLLFDPPSIASVIEATNRAISELEWRINAVAECTLPYKWEVSMDDHEYIVDWRNN